MWSFVPIVEFSIAMYIAVSKLGIDRVEFLEMYSMLSLVVSLFLQLPITLFTRTAVAVFICAGLLQYSTIIWKSPESQITSFGPLLSCQSDRIRAVSCHLSSNLNKA